MTLTAVFKLLHFLMILGRCHAMYKQTMSVAKGVGMGILAGAAVVIVAILMDRLTQPPQGGPHEEERQQGHPHRGQHHRGYGKDPQVSAA